MVVLLSINNLIGASLGGFKGLDMDEAMSLYLELADEFDLDAVEVRFEKEKERPSLWPWEAGSNVRNFLKRFKFSGAHLPFVYLNPISTNPRIRKESISQLKEAIRRSAELGMSYTVMHARGLAPDLSRTEVFQEWAKVIKELMDCAEENSILLTIENADFLWNIADVAKIVRKLNSRWLKMSFDIGHAYMRKVPPLQKYPVKELSLRALDIFFPFILKRNMPYEDYGSIRNFIKSEHDLISNIHIHDYDGISDHLVVGEGKIDFSFFSELRESFHGAYIFEMEFKNYYGSFGKNYDSFMELLK